MMGSGKTTVGQHLAADLGYRFLDLDALVETVANCSIAEIFASEGETRFRDLESRVLSEVSAYASQRLAIATGGGVVLRPENWSYLRHGLVIWLDVPLSVIYDRIASDTSRPLLQTPDPQAKLKELMQEREHLYSQADLRIAVQSQDTPSTIVSTILDEIPSVLRHSQRIERPILSSEFN
jgi:shikimate kinase